MAGARYDVNGRTVFITGAARGIGKATAQRLHRKGANVALVGLEPELLEQNAAQLGERAIAIEADVTDLGALERAVEGTVARFGGIDVAIANAGIAFTGPLMAAPVARVERTLEVNLLGVWRTDRAVIEELTKRGGYLLNISSLTAILRPPMIAAYATAKAGVEALSDALRVESAPSGVAVGCAYFGFMDTDLVKAAYAEPSAEAMNARTPSFIRNPAPLSKAIDAIERGVERRRRASVGAALARADARRAGPVAAADRTRRARPGSRARRGDADRGRLERGGRPGRAARRRRQGARPVAPAERPAGCRRSSPRTRARRRRGSGRGRAGPC